LCMCMFNTYTNSFIYTHIYIIHMRYKYNIKKNKDFLEFKCQNQVEGVCYAF
jgi:hypothetical protein